MKDKEEEVWWGGEEECDKVVGNQHQSSIIITAVRSGSGNIKASRIKTNPKCCCEDDPITLELVFLEERA